MKQEGCLTRILAVGKKGELVPVGASVEETFNIERQLLVKRHAALGVSAIRELPHRLPWAFSYEYNDLTAAHQGRLEEGTLVGQDASGTNVVAFSQSSLDAAILHGVRIARTTELASGHSLMLGGIQPCLRNERLDQIVEGWRESHFLQANLEIAARTSGSLSEFSLQKTLLAATASFFEGTGIPQQCLRIRVNVPRIVSTVLADLPDDERCEILDLVDDLSLQRSRGDREAMADGFTHMLAAFRRFEEPATPRYQFVENFVRTGRYHPQLIRQVPGAWELLGALTELVHHMKRAFPNATWIADALSMRRQYDGIAWQIDIVHPTRTFSEVGGGGIYTSRAKEQWARDAGYSAPSNFVMGGFAIGLSRLQTVLNVISHPRPTTTERGAVAAG